MSGFRTDRSAAALICGMPKRGYHHGNLRQALVDAALAAGIRVSPVPGPSAAVALLSGSGPQDRNSTVFGHRPFLVLADYLTRRGIAVLRFDDRGVGSSTGNFAMATTPDFASDALAALDAGNLDEVRQYLLSIQAVAQSADGQ